MTQEQINVINETKRGQNEQWNKVGHKIRYVLNLEEYIRMKDDGERLNHALQGNKHAKKYAHRRNTDTPLKKSIPTANLIDGIKLHIFPLSTDDSNWKILYIVSQDI